MALLDSRRQVERHFTIGRLARAAGVPVSTVRYYEQRGLLRPTLRTPASYRLYDRDGLRRLRFIRAAQASGFTLEDIAALLEIRDGAGDPCREVGGLLERRLRRIEEELARLTRTRRILSESIRWCREPRAEGSCQVIEELDSIAGREEESPRAVVEGTLDRLDPERVAEALYRSLAPCLGELGLYVTVKRLLARGRPVAAREVARSLHVPVDDVLAALEVRPDIERDEAGRVVGWGLTLSETPHRFTVGGHELHTWCALDALFLPVLLRSTVRIRSACARTGASIRMTVRGADSGGGADVEDLSPAGARVSLVLPGLDAGGDVRGTFCERVHFLRDEAVASAWTAEHPGGFTLPVEEAARAARALGLRILEEARA